MRSAGLLVYVDRLRMQIQQWRFRRKNKAFRAANPDIPLPAEEIIYETFNADITKYYEDGKEVAKWLVHTIEPYIGSKSIKILDWGCGPARVVRHLHRFLDAESELFGSDFNSQTIAWCKEHIPNVTFGCNDLSPPLPYEPSTFAVLYGISVLTHLNEERNKSWIEEIFRVLAPGGIALITTQGKVFVEKLSSKEKLAFQDGRLVVRGHVEEGRRTFSAFHPEERMRELFDNFTVLEHQPGERQGRTLDQDIWILQKPVK